MENDTITIPISKYEDMVNKIARFNTLINCIRQEIEAGKSDPVDNDLVLCVTGLKAYKIKKEGNLQ